MSKDDDSDKPPSDLLNLIIDHCYASVHEPPSSSETKSDNEPSDSPQHVFKVPAIPTIKNKVVNKNEISKNNLECQDPAPKLNGKTLKHVFEHEGAFCLKGKELFHLPCHGCNKKIRFYRKCKVCAKTYNCRIMYLQHKQRCRHKNNHNKRSSAPLLCGICLQLFDCQASFDKHKKRCLHRCIHPGCYKSFILRTEMIKHIYENHMGDYDVHYLKFKNRNILNLWKVNEPIVNMLSYENKSFQDVTHHYFTCHKSGIATVDTCPAKMIIYETDSSMEVQYVPFHNHELLPDGVFNYKSYVPLICLYPECIQNVYFYKQSDMVAHLEKCHNRNINCQYFNFNNILEFFIWKRNSHSPHFLYLFRLKGYAISKSVHANYSYYMCGFDGKQLLSKPTQCLARMVVYELDSCVKVKYFPYHIHPLISQKMIQNGLCDKETPLVSSVTKTPVALETSLEKNNT